MSGTTLTAKSRLTAQEVCLIIEASAKANVTSLEFEGLRFEIGEIVPAKDVVTSSNAVELTLPTEAAISEMHAQQNETTLQLEESRAKENRLALMLIEDPAEAERLFLSGELEEMDGDDGGDEDDDSGE